jgi:hypothetical protein
MGEGTEIAGAVILLEAGESEAGDGVVKVDFQEEEAFVVAEADVVAGLEFLDEAAFEEEGFGLAFNGVDVEVMDGIDEGVEFEVPALAAGGVEVLGDALAEIAGLADVDDSAETVFHQVDTGFVRHGAELVSDVIGDRH